MKRKKDASVSRKEFIGITWLFSLLALFGQSGLALVRFLTPRVDPNGFGGKVVAGRVEEFSPGTVSRIQKGRFYISRLEDGGFLALWQRCTHLGCTVPWVEAETRFHCPCHSSIFSTNGTVVSGPAPRPMDLFPIEIIEGEVVVDTGNPIQRDKMDDSLLVYA
ncbi:MAG: Rieske 2Fe-2S domain-containing protein [Chloroflexota bacterium]